MNKKSDRYQKGAKPSKSVLRSEVKKINNTSENKLKALPAIVMASSQDLDQYATTQRYKSFDRGKRALNHSTLLPSRDEGNRNVLRNKRLINKSVDEGNGSFDALTSIMNLSKNMKNKNKDMPKKLDPISCPISPAPYNNELWPRTIKNSNEILSDFNTSPKGLIDKYEGERRTKALSVNRLASKNKPLSMWDAMSIHDIQKFKQEVIVGEQKRKEQQRQLRLYYDQQVMDKSDRAR